MTPQPFSRFCSRLFLPDFPFFSSNILSFILGTKWATPFRARYFYRGISFWSVQKNASNESSIISEGSFGSQTSWFWGRQEPRLSARGSEMSEKCNKQTRPNIFFSFDVFPVFKELFRHEEKWNGFSLRNALSRRCQNSFTAQALKRKGLAEVKLFIQP